jgi:hypothetical protein
MKDLISLARAKGGRIMDLLLRTETGEIFSGFYGPAPCEVFDQLPKILVNWPFFPAMHVQGSKNEATRPHGARAGAASGSNSGRLRKTR